MPILCFVQFLTVDPAYTQLLAGSISILLRFVETIGIVYTAKAQIF